MVGTKGPWNGAEEEKNIFSFARFFLLLLFVSGFVAFIIFDVYQYISFDVLKANRLQLQLWVSNHAAIAAAAFVVTYALAVAFSLPGAVLITLTGGFLFGPYFGTVYAVIGATIGAICIFLAAKYIFGDFLEAKAGPRVKCMEAGFRQNELSYLLILRLVPLFPFWLVNLVAAFLRVSLRNYAIGTVLGIIPSTFVYTLAGDRAGALLNSEENLGLEIIFEPRFLTLIFGLIVLACIPIVYKSIKGRKDVPNT